MAPAGSFECLQAAIQGGADSVYFGVGRLNMRSRSASNFLPEDLQEVVGICHRAGVKAYLTLNVTLYAEDLAAMRETLVAARDASVDAVIAFDMAVIGACRELGLEVHISTQMSVSNIESLRFWARYADVVVLARELSLTQVKAIHEAIVRENICGPSGKQVRIEMFVHGALCMAVSGKCFLSLHNCGASANRGACLQLCRRGYRVTDLETGTEMEVDNKYIMSPKDLCTIEFLPMIVESGVRVFKIEGRARGPEYVDAVVRCYDEAINAVIEGTFTEERKAEWDTRLARVFNRGFWDGYYQGQTLGEWNDSYGSKATEKKVYAAKAVKYFPKIGVAEFQVEAHEISVGDSLLVTGTTTGALRFGCTEIRYDLKPVAKAEKGWRISMPVPEKVRPNDKLFILVQTNT